ncbi:5871_t:CDS:2, partial [Funneliformis mosseae]
QQQILKKNLENKKKKPIYTGYDDEEFNFGGGEISKKNILSHYDEETSKQHFLPPLQQELPFYSEYHDHNRLNPEHSTNGNVNNKFT